MQKSYLFGIFSLLFTLGAIGYYAYSMSLKDAPVDDPAIASFEDCVQAGNPVMESYPRQCRTRSGQNFVEQVPEEPMPPQEERLASPINVEEPLPNATIVSPLTVKGVARGMWYFEASFPVELVDASGTQLVVLPAQAQGEWMTENFVPFSVVLPFATPTTPTGTLILHRDNPSGLPENDASIEIPVKFAQ